MRFMQNHKLHESELTKFQLQIGRVSVAQMFDKTEREGEICEWEKLENDCIAAPPPYTIQQTQGESLSQRFTLQSLQYLKVTETSP